MVLHHIDGPGVCQSFESGARLERERSNMASAGCLLVLPAQVRLSQEKVLCMCLTENSTSALFIGLNHKYKVSAKQTNIDGVNTGGR